MLDHRILYVYFWNHDHFAIDREVQKIVEESRKREEKNMTSNLIKEMRKRLEEQHEQIAKRRTDLEGKQWG